MPRSRERATLESGPVLDLARLIPRGAGRPGHHFQGIMICADGDVIRAEICLREDDGVLNVTSEGEHQLFALTCDKRHFGGRQWYVVCLATSRRVRVLFRPRGATRFASRHAWGAQRVAYASQFLSPVQRAWRTQARVKARVLGDADPDEWDLPPKPKWMRWRTYRRWEAKFDEAEEMIDEQCAWAMARLLKFGD
jgi:hypothetical protein